MQARSAVFDLYGDHLLDRGGWAPISATVGLLGSLGIAPPAVRTAVSRIVREGWLEALERHGRGYAVTPRGRERLQDARARIYRIRSLEWDGRWHLVVVPRAVHRSERLRTARSLEFLGYGRLATDTWVAPRESPELERALRPSGGGWSAFRCDFQGRDRELVAKVWDIARLGTAYQRFTDLTLDQPLPQTPKEAFVSRTNLVHAWRIFLFSDPGLPAQVLPLAWPGHRAAQLFDERQAALGPAAGEWVEHWLGRACAD